MQASFPLPDPTLSQPEDGQEEPAATKWDQSNTVLLDDTIAKAASEPHNLLQIDEFTREIKQGGKDVVLNRVLAYIDDLKWEADISAAMRERPFVMGEVKDEGAKEAKLETESELTCAAWKPAPARRRNGLENDTPEISFHEG